jgi:predicted membrane-bound spermidine synthase
MKSKSNSTSKIRSGSSAGSKSEVPFIIRKELLLTISFFEGAAVMIIELLGAKIIAPFYGTSMYVWASVLGVTLFALASGYYAGGWISKKYKSENILFLVIGIGAIFTILAPIIAPSIMVFTSDLGIRTGSLVSVFLYLLVPVSCMGMVSPMITQFINNGNDSAGKSAGTVYAISTIGGILATFIAGFYLLPTLGINVTSWITGGFLVIISLTWFILQRNTVRSVMIAGSFLLIIAFSSFRENPAGNIKVRYQSSGILGEWTVVDLVVAIQDGKEMVTRQLLLNGIDQTYTEVGNEPVSMWNYPHKIAALAGIKPIGAKALLLGMGGGSIAHNLILLGFDLDIVEIDERITDITQRYFGFNPEKASLIIDDARHYIYTCHKKYDLVIIDLLNGEVQPSHIFTLEGLGQLKKVLKEDALVIVNFQGRFDMTEPNLSLAPRSVFKTLQAAGYKIQFCERVPEGQKKLTGDLIIFGSAGNTDFIPYLQKEIRYNDIFTMEHFTFNDFIPSMNIDVTDATILTDDRQNLELLNAPTILQWRKNKMEYAINNLIKKGLPIYH